MLSQVALTYNASRQLMNRFSVQYTSEQQQVIQHTGRHARIIAVAGSGKTQTMTAYVLQRLAQGARPRRVLVLMYNKSAQLDFQRRLAAQQSNRPQPDVRTFHSLGYRICQTLVKQGDMPPFEKALLTDTEIEQTVWHVLRQCAPESLADDVLSRKKKWVEPAISFFEKIKATMQSPADVFEASDLPKACQFFLEAFDRFEDWRMENARMSFSDLIYEPVLRFQREPHLAQQFSGHLTDIVVDEFQDINPAQQALLDVIRGDSAKVVVVGDPDQTIYEFRGSNPELLTHQFHERYHPAVDYQLSHTFRYGDALSLLANQTIAGNYAPHESRVQCVSHNLRQQTSVRLCPSKTSTAAVFKTIQQWAQDRPLSDIAVINRLWANSARLELTLLANNVPYRLDKNTTVLERHELRVFNVLFQIADGQARQWTARARKAAWQTLLTQPYLKIKKTVVDGLIKSLVTQTTNLGQTLRNAVPDTLSKYQSEQLFERARIIEKAERANVSAYDVVHGWIIATDYLSELSDSAFSASAVEDAQGTVKAFAGFVRAAKWPLVEASALWSDLASHSVGDDQDAVFITSIHKSKGREWPCVVIPEVNKRFYPFQPELEMSTPTSINSERRLLYVAMTRARDEVVFVTPPSDQPDLQSPLLPPDFVSGAQTFAQSGEAELNLPPNMHRPSVEFYAELRGKSTVNWQSSPASATQSVSRVNHPTLGLGQIVSETDARLSIVFDKDGRVRDFDRDIVWPLLTLL